MREMGKYGKSANGVEHAYDVAANVEAGPGLLDRIETVRGDDT